jgi:quercetin dioxygenase-like cupin family protein
LRLIITGHDAEGRSTVESDEQLTDRGMVPLFTASVGDPLDSPATGAPHIASVPTPGSVAWFFVDISPEEQMRASLAKGVTGIDADGWHTTPTIDYIHILDGDVVLALDTTEVELQAGDCVVQRATRHAWRNRTDRVVRMAAVMVSV